MLVRSHGPSGSPSSRAEVGRVAPAYAHHLDPLDPLAQQVGHPACPTDQPVLLDGHRLPPGVLVGVVEEAAVITDAGSRRASSTRSPMTSTPTRCAGCPSIDAASEVVQPTPVHSDGARNPAASEAKRVG